MYYKEEIIDGILCWKGTPNGAWIEKTKEQLTDEIVKLKAEIYRLREENISLSETEENHP